MELLIIGGTIFLGRHLVEIARAAGHTVTMFNRGKHGPDLFPGVERVTGDREHDLELLAGRRWDAVVDTCGYVPRIVRASAEALRDACDHYTFVSSMSVYDLHAPVGYDEMTPVETREDPAVEEVTGETYGPLKALCEQAVEETLPGRTLTIRPGLIVGPHDPSERFTYWPGRIARGGALLAPGDPDAPVQFIDARDLAAWMLRMIEQRATGVYNATGPATTLTMGEMIAGTIAALNADAEPVWVPDDFLLEHEVGPWMELPVWLPASEGTIHHADVSKAVGAGLTFRPVGEIARDTLQWDQTRPDEQRGGHTLAPEKERAVLDAWRART
ncbi:MAG TPA: SDR family oxidoreductase [Actinomycetota bacterium]